MKIFKTDLKYSTIFWLSMLMYIIASTIYWRVQSCVPIYDAVNPNVFIFDILVTFGIIIYLTICLCNYSENGSLKRTGNWNILKLIYCINYALDSLHKYDKPDKPDNHNT